MTTIAYDGLTLASDSASFGGDLRVGTSTKKIHCRDGLIFAFAGNSVLQEPWMKWFQNGADPSKKPAGVRDDEDDLGMWAWQDSKLWQYSPELPYPWEVPIPFAMGSGTNYAMGAFRLGNVIHRVVSAEEAVLAAVACDVHSGGPVQVIDLHDLQKADAA